MPMWAIWLVVILSGGMVAFSYYYSSKPEAQDKVKSMVGGKKKSVSKDSEGFDEKDLENLKETAEDFLEFDTIHNGMISFKTDPNYFTMAFGVNGVNISMYSSEERAALKSGFMNILNSMKEDVQFLVQSRYVDLSNNFKVFKPIIENNDKERERLIEKAKSEKSEVVKRKIVNDAEKLKQRNAYANHIIDFFNFYTKQAECIYIRIFVVLNYRYTGLGKFQSREQIIEEAYNILSNKVRIYQEQFEAMKLKTYSLDSNYTANILYSTLNKNESSFMKLEDAIKNGLTDLVVQNPPGEEGKTKKVDKYTDSYEYDYYDEAAITDED